MNCLLGDFAQQFAFDSQETGYRGNEIVIPHFLIDTFETENLKWLMEFLKFIYSS